MRKVCVLELLTSKQVQSFRSIHEEEVESLIEQISSDFRSGRVVNLSHSFLSMVNDVTVRSIMGSKSTEQDLLLREIKNANEFAAQLDIANMFPSSRLASVLTGSVRRAQQFHRHIDQLFENVIRGHRIKEGREDAEDLLSILRRLHDEGSRDNLISIDSVKAVILDVIAAGTESAATVLDWIMAKLMKNPGIMKKAQTEIRQAHRGHDNSTISDTAGLEIIHQIIKETMRLHCPVPLLTPRECQETCNILGYDIPKGTTVIINAWALGRNSNYWKDAGEFKPKRFAKVDAGNEQSDEKDFKSIPFGAGRRKCPGVLFGSTIVELVLTDLLYHFDWELPNGMSPDELDMTEAFGITARRKSPLLLHAIPYHVSYLDQ